MRANLRLRVCAVNLSGAEVGWTVGFESGSGEGDRRLRGKEFFIACRTSFGVLAENFGRLIGGEGLEQKSSGKSATRAKNSSVFGVAFEKASMRRFIEKRMKVYR